MKIELIKGTVVNQLPYKKGDIIEVEDYLGQYLIYRKSAVEYTEIKTTEIKPTKKGV